MSSLQLKIGTSGSELYLSRQTDIQNCFKKCIKSVHGFVLNLSNYSSKFQYLEYSKLNLIPDCDIILQSFTDLDNKVEEYRVIAYQKVENLVNEEFKLRKSLDNQKDEIRVLETKIECTQKDLKNAKDDICLQEDRVKQAVTTVHSCRKKATTAKENNNIAIVVGSIGVASAGGILAGCALLAAPITVPAFLLGAATGTAAGAILGTNEKKIECDKRVDIASSSLNDTKKRRDKIKQQRKDMSLSLEGVRASMSNLRREHNMIDLKLSTTRHDLDNITKIQNTINKIKRKCSELLGSAQILHDETKQAYAFEPLITPLQELVSGLSTLEEHRMLSNCGVSYLLNDLRYHVRSIGVDSSPESVALEYMDL